MTQATYVSATYSTARWDGSLYKIRSRTDLSGCSAFIYTNPDGVPGVGDRFEARATNCRQNINQGSWTNNGSMATTLTTLSNTQLPAFAAWTISEDTSGTGSLSWDVPVTVSNLRFTGQSTYTHASTFQADHKADGTQQDTLSSQRITSKGSDNLGAFDFVVNSTLSCSYPSGQNQGSCSNGPVTLQGTLASLPADAIMTQTRASPPEFTITQAGQTVRVAYDPATGGYTVTTASGIQLVTSLLDLINGYR